MRTISRKDLQEFLVDYPDLKLIEVLPESCYQDFHLHGAINIPLNNIFEERFLLEVPDKNQMIIVYSLNFDCKNAEQAMNRLNVMGYKNIYHYEPGKMDWYAAQLPVEFGHQ